MIFHVRDAAPAKKLVGAMHAEWKRKSPRPSANRSSPAASRKRSRARTIDHPPLFLPDDDHLIFVAPSRGTANSMRRALEKALGNTVEHVVTRFVKAPTAARAAARRQR